jgi:hypothetical protein
MAVSSGALGIEAAVVVGADGTDDAGRAAVRDLAAGAPVFTAE